MISALKKQHAKQAQEKLLAGSAYKDQDLVFATALGTQFLYSNFRKYFCDVRENAGLPDYVHLHTLRHTFATTLISKGEDIRRISAWLGHSDPAFTYRVYHHYIPQKLDDKEAERLNSLIFGGSRN